MQRLLLPASRASYAQPLLSKFFTVLPPLGEPNEDALRPTLLPADSCRTAGIEEMGLHRIRQSVVAYNKRPSRRNSGLLDYDRQPKGTNVSPERRGRQGIKLTTGSEACGREASRRAGKARPVPLTRLPLITRLLLLPLARIETHDAARARGCWRSSHDGQPTCSLLRTHKPGSPLLPCSTHCSTAQTLF